MIVGPVVRSALMMAAALLGAGSAQAQLDEDGGWPIDPKCNARTASRLTIAEIHANIRRLEGDCVAVKGLLDGEALYADHEAIYRNTASFREKYEPKDDDRPWSAKLGVRPVATKVGLQPFSDKMRQLTLIGRVHDCRRDWGTKESKDGEIIISMGHGWCHYNSEPVLKVSAFQNHIPVSLRRKRRASDARRLGDLRPVDPSDPLAKTLEPVIAKWLSALRTGDRKAIIELHDLHVDLDATGLAVGQADRQRYDGRRASELLTELYDHPERPVAALRANAVPEVRQLFVGRWSKAEPEEAWACWHVAAEKAVSWPISSLDTSDVEGRPYTCLMIIGQKVMRAQDEPVTTEWRTRFYSDPRWTEE